MKYTHEKATVNEWNHDLNKFVPAGERDIATIIEVEKATFSPNKFISLVMYEISRYRSENSYRYDIQIAMTHDMIMLFNALRPIQLPLTTIPRYAEIYGYDVDLLRDETGLKTVVKLVLPVEKETYVRLPKGM